LPTVVDLALGALRLEPLVALVDAPNTASHALLRRTGFTVIGTVQGPAHRLHVYRCVRSAGVSTRAAD
jgi:RimJ/RimL family protein N-acetyltransferase